MFRYMLPYHLTNKEIIKFLSISKQVRNIIHLLERESHDQGKANIKYYFKRHKYEQLLYREEPVFTMEKIIGIMAKQEWLNEYIRPKRIPSRFSKNDQHRKM